MADKIFHLVGYASGVAGAEEGSGAGPLAIQQSPYMNEFIKNDLSFYWDVILKPASGDNDVQKSVHDVASKLALAVSRLIRDKASFCVLGGDHSAALGTWSGVYDALHQEGDIGLIWIDAHMDSHTPETSESKRIHGMPLASLMGYGPSALTQILKNSPKIKPENVCLIGVRSYERGEADLLKRLNVRVYLMEEVTQRGFVTVLAEAIEKVSEKTIGYGLSLDLDGIDPKDAPGVDVPEPNGISADDVLVGLEKIISDPKFIGSEIVEFDPYHDIDKRTGKLIFSFLKILSQKKFST